MFCPIIGSRCDKPNRVYINPTSNRDKFKKNKKKIAILEQNETTIQEIIHRIKKKGGQYLFQDDEITDLLKQVLKKNLTSEKLDLEKDLRHTRLLIRRLRQDLEKIYTKETTHQNKFQSLSLFKLLKEKETS